MKRFTRRIDQLTMIDADQIHIQPDQTVSGPAIDHLGRCEDFLELILHEKTAISAEMDRLRSKNQTKSVRFRELFISKLIYANIEAQLAHCGLGEITKEP